MLYLLPVIYTSIIYQTIAILPLHWFFRPKIHTCWGIIYDHQKQRPVAYATIYLKDINNNKILEHTISDRAGCYGFKANSGQFQVKVVHSGFNTAEKAISIEKDGFISLDFAMQPQQGTSFPKLQQLFIEQGALATLLILFSGSISAFYLVISQKNLAGFLILSIYLAYFLLLISKIFANRGNFWGHVQESNTNNRIQGVIVRVFSPRSNRQFDLQITDQEGRFNFKLSVGSYLILTGGNGYIIDYKCYAKTELYTSASETIFLTEAIENGLDSRLIIRMKISRTKILAKVVVRK